MDQAAALQYLATYLGVDEDDFEYEWDHGPGHTFYQHSTAKRHTVRDPVTDDGEPSVVSSA